MQLENLSPVQKKAVTSTSGPVLILAGAGSGKTRVITFRTSYMLAGGIPASNILCVTFTNKAASEMKERIKNLAGEKARGVLICTFHSFCLRVLSAEHLHAGFKKKFTIYSSADQKDAMHNVMQEHGIDPSYDPDELLVSISAFKNRLLGPEQAMTEFPDHPAAAVYSHYQRFLVAHSAVDFDDLLYYTALLFQNREILEKYQNRYRYIMVDEYQDTNHAQYKITRMLASRYRNICVVGDDDQSIYAFRGADVSNILNFEKDFPEAEVLHLDCNYRSSGIILQAAGAIISCNQKRKAKNLTAARAEGTPLEAMEAEDPQKEAELIIGNMCLKRSEGARFRDFAVLFRIGAQSRIIEEALRRNKIPYKVWGGTDYYERKEIRDLLAYLRLMNNNDDELSLLRIINYPKRKIGQAALARLQALAIEKKCGLFTALESARETGLEPAILSEISHFCTLIKNYGQAMQGKEIGSLLAEFTDIIAFKAEIEKDTPDKKKTEIKLQNIDEFIDSIYQYCKKSKKPSLSDYLLKLSLMLQTDQDEENSRDAVNLLTIHSAKGLEFKHVYIAGFEEEYLPHARSGEEGLEEERRLCYVAFTRAIETLTLTFCARRSRMGKFIPRQPSRFLQEIPDKLIIRNYGRYVFTDNLKPREDTGKKSLDYLLKSLSG